MTIKLTYAGVFMYNVFRSDFLRGQLPTKANGLRGWTVDFLDIQERALVKARPFREKAVTLFAETETAEAALQDKKQTKKPKRAELEALEQKWKAILRQARDTQSEAQTIEDAIYDLKAVNPNRVIETDQRTPSELLDTIAIQSQDADSALTRLRKLVEERQG